jgi:hypothetical protein
MADGKWQMANGQARISALLPFAISHLPFAISSFPFWLNN